MKQLTARWSEFYSRFAYQYNPMHLDIMFSMAVLESDTMIHTQIWHTEAAWRIYSSIT